MITDDGIRAALHQMADRAPDPERVRARLAGRTRAHRQRRAILLTGAAVAAAVVTVPTVVTLRPGSPLRPAGGARALLDGGRVVRLPYRFGWVPDGLAETSRSVTVRDAMLHSAGRHWVMTEAAVREMEGPERWRLRGLSLTVGPQDLVHPGDGEESPVTVNGVEGTLFRVTDETALLAWPAGDGIDFVVQASAFDDAEGVALRAAESVEPDEDAVVEAPVRWGWLPAQVDAGTYRISSSTGSATLGLGSGSGPFLDITLSEQYLNPGSPEEVKRAIIRGRNGLIMREDQHVVAQVVLEDGRHLRVLGPGATDEDLVRVADELEILPPPDTGWAG